VGTPNSVGWPAIAIQAGASTPSAVRPDAPKGKTSHPSGSLAERYIVRNLPHVSTVDGDAVMTSVMEWDYEGAVRALGKWPENESETATLAPYVGGNFMTVSMNKEWD
jgi:hypothetical protein